MLVKPNEVKFEKKEDIVDYVCKGLPPSKKNYTAVMNAVKCPVSTKSEVPEGSVYINENLFIECNAHDFAEVMDQVYKIRIKHRNTVLAVGGLIALGLIVGGVNHSKKNDEDDEE